jgi:hypothetical protein
MPIRSIHVRYAATALGNEHEQGVAFHELGMAKRSRGTVARGLLLHVLSCMQVYPFAVGPAAWNGRLCQNWCIIGCALTGMWLLFGELNR